MFKKLISTFIAVILTVMCFSNSVFGADISEYYLYTSNASTALTVSGTTLNCRSAVTGYSGITTKITITQEIQKKSGSTWRSINGRGTTKFTFYAIFEQSYSNMSSGTYRVKTIAKVYSGTNYETIVHYSFEKSIK